MDIDKIIEFLETEIINVTFSEDGLRYLSLKEGNGEKFINLKNINLEEDKSSMEYLLVSETWKFLETGSHNMPLDLNNFTKFQHDVLNAVCDIEVGQTRTYKEVAEILGKPLASQAVGNAISKNPVSYFIPSYRVTSKRGIMKCKTGAGTLREKLLRLEGHDIEKIKDNLVCSRKKCCTE